MGDRLVGHFHRAHVTGTQCGCEFFGRPKIRFHEFDSNGLPQKLVPTQAARIRRKSRNDRFHWPKLRTRSAVQDAQPQVSMVGSGSTPLARA
jgi:hypothetical protein